MIELVLLSSYSASRFYAAKCRTGFTLPVGTTPSVVFQNLINWLDFEALPLWI